MATGSDYHKLVVEDGEPASASSVTSTAEPSKGIVGDGSGGDGSDQGFERVVSLSESVKAWQINGGGRNVQLSLWFTFFAGTARGVWSYTILSGYLYALTASNAAVGVAEGAQGLAQLVMALVAGVLLVRDWRRDRVLKIGSTVGLVAAAGLLLALSMDASWGVWSSSSNASSVTVMTVALSLFGSYQGLWNTGLETIYADSIPTGKRAR